MGFTGPQGLPRLPKHAAIDRSRALIQRVAFLLTADSPWDLDPDATRRAGNTGLGSAGPTSDTQEAASALTGATADAPRASQGRDGQASARSLILRALSRGAMGDGSRPATASTAQPGGDPAAATRAMTDLEYRKISYHLLRS